MHSSVYRVIKVSVMTELLFIELDTATFLMTHPIQKNMFVDNEFC